MRKTVLAIGIDPALADLSNFPTLTPELVRAHVDQEIDRVRSLGYDVGSCLLDPATAEQTVETLVRAKAYDCIVLGAGLRQPPELLLLFEKIINILHELAPQSRIAFNTKPGDTAEAVQRWLV